ncbi:carboxymuconolactone decarboxylase family protein [Pseudochryseolinea flava]|uniref:Carboxymuconolactone decarboxylase family protein n=1 Tax=Pseudochryseolinea flava TaxID=2059302 RepID=A0A364XWB9_9BACT|nr:carboxymuconolactone decarboxylase family protein [Pseudochryseolinea flava]RAV98687.1 carboxymuconolactone decarboxylase family protein [Pseudochryseolinea flava]
MERISYQELPKGFYNVLMKAQEYVDNAGLDHSLLELIRMRVSLINGCAYCIDMHYKLGLHLGDTAQRLTSVSVWREAPYYSEKEKAALEFAERLTKVDSDHHPETLHDAINKYFSKEEIAYLTLAIIQINAWNRLVRSFGTVAGNFKVPEKVNA